MTIADASAWLKQHIDKSITLTGFRKKLQRSLEQ